MGLKILVTGANGFIGRNVIHHLGRDPDFELVATDLHDTIEPLYPNGLSEVNYLRGDISHQAFIKQLADNYKFDAIIHLAAVISQAGDTLGYYSIIDSNVHSTMMLSELARKHRARMLFLSTALVYGNKKAPFTEDMAAEPAVMYAVSKYLSEQLIQFYFRRHAVSFGIFRGAVFYGPGQRGEMFIPSIISHLSRGKPFDMTGGEQLRDFVYIEDLVQLLKMALKVKTLNDIYNVGSGQSESMKDVAALVEEALKLRGKVNLGVLPYRENEVWDYRLDNSKLENKFNWKPATPLKEGLEKTIAWYKSS